MVARKGRSRARRRILGSKNRKGSYAKRGMRAVKRMLKRELNKNLETKHANSTSTDGVEIFHNNFVTLDPTILFTTPGPLDPTLNASDNRIGDEIMLRGVKLSMMIELNERYSDVTFRLLVVKCAKGDTPTRATLFNGLSGNKMLDTLNTERYTIIGKKMFKMKAPAASVPVPAEVGGIGSGIVITGAARDNTISRATKIVKLWIPGSAFKKSCKIQYEQGSSQPKFFDYHALLYAYSNYSTLQDVYYVARVNDYVKTMYYKDG